MIAGVLSMLGIVGGIFTLAYAGNHSRLSRVSPVERLVLLNPHLNPVVNQPNMARTVSHVKLIWNVAQAVRRNARRVARRRLATVAVLTASALTLVTVPLQPVRTVRPVAAVSRLR